MARRLDGMDDEERLEQKLTFYYQPYSKNGYEFRKHMDFEEPELKVQDRRRRDSKGNIKEINWEPIGNLILHKRK